MSDELLDLGRSDIILLADRCERAEEQVEGLTSLVQQMDGLLTMVAYRGAVEVDDDWKHDAIQVAHAARASIAAHKEATP